MIIQRRASHSGFWFYTGLQQIYADNAAPKKVFSSVARRLEAIGDEVRRQYKEKVL